MAFAEALQDYHRGNFKDPLWLNTSYGPRERMPVEVFFRTESDLSDLENYALSLCRGSILDIGAGAGASSLIFQKYEWPCWSLERSALACRVMQERGVRNVLHGEVCNFTGMRFDTLWLMMNGVGIFGHVGALSPGLAHLKQLLLPGGRIILDSSDIRYLYHDELPEARYYGEIEYQYEYKGEKEEWFSWLYVDQRLLMVKAREAGLKCQIVFENDQDEYLALLTPVP